MGTTPGSGTAAQAGSRPRIVVVGGGFGGLYCAKAMRKLAADITIVDRRNFHLFQPLLYQVATGGLSPANIAYPLRAIVKRRRELRVLLAEVIDFDAEKRKVILRDGELEYDILVVAAGVGNHYFGHADWPAHAQGLKTIEDATRMRSRILGVFEAAEREPDPQRRKEWLTFVIIGGGPTGVELAGTLAEIARATLRDEFRAINPADARILLVEGGDRVLPTYLPELSQRAADSLARLGVTVRCRTMVTDIQADEVTLRVGDETQRLRAGGILWAAGVRATPLADALARATGARQDRMGRIEVDSGCMIPGHSEIFVVGDMARYPGPDGTPLPGVAPVAMQQGAFVARAIRQRLAGKPTPAFRYKDHGSMATIGRAAAVADLGWIRFSGYPAWLAWLLLHVFFLIEFENRVLVMLQWAWNYFTWGRSARLITEPADETSGGGITADPPGRRPA